MDKKEKVDNEWVQLMIRAKQMGCSINEVRAFILQAVASNRLKSGKAVTYPTERKKCSS